MSNTFDDLIDDFLNSKRDDSKPKSKGSTEESMFKKIFETIANFRKMDSSEDLEKAINDELGEPNEIEEHIEDGFLYQKLTWNTPDGRFVKIVVTDINSEEGKIRSQRVHTLTLEEQLQLAVESEDYELAAKLRDELGAQLNEEIEEQNKNVKKDSK